MAIEDIFGQLANTSMQLPLQYGGMYAGAYNPMFNYYTQGAGSAAGLGGGAMGLYGQLQGQQSAERTAALPYQWEAQKFNALAPLLSGLISQNSGFDGFNMPQLSAPSYGGGGGDGRDRGDRGGDEYWKVVGDAYSKARAYDNDMQGAHQQMIGMLPKAPYMNPRPAPQPQPQQAPPQAAPRMTRVYDQYGGWRNMPNEEADSTKTPFGAHSIGMGRNAGGFSTSPAFQRPGAAFPKG
jgi:hypothetical protein